MPLGGPLEGGLRSLQATEMAFLILPSASGGCWGDWSAVRPRCLAEGREKKAMRRGVAAVRGCGLAILMPMSANLSAFAFPLAFLRGILDVGLLPAPQELRIQPSLLEGYEIPTYL